jgi:two-component system sensor histidine kinase AlgZ
MDRPLRPDVAASSPPQVGAKRTSIGESDPRPGPFARRMPDFRNLGVLLRILVATSLLSVVAAVLLSPRLDRFGWTLLDVCATVQPPLVLVLITLAAACPMLDRLRYPVAAGGVIALSAIAAGASHAFGSMLLGAAGSDPGRHALLGMALAAALLGWLDLRSRALSPALVEARLQALQARIRPHFLFNSLTAVLSLIRADPRRAEQVLEDLADLFRALLADGRTLSTLGREMDLARQYLAIEALRLGERLRVEWSLEQMPPEARLPPMILQPLLENAVYHGIEPLPDPGPIRVSVVREADRVLVRITNPVSAAVMTERRPGNRIAIDNIRQRLQLHFDAEASLRHRIEDGRYEVQLTLPYTIHDRQSTAPGALP